MRMSQSKAKFASAIVAGLLTGLPFATLQIGAAPAAESCLTQPNGETPQGKHWYYRIERGTGRHCWYLRGEDESPRVAAPEPAASRPAPRRAESATARAIANARAEWSADK